jgi:hypothetical protein
MNFFDQIERDLVQAAAVRPARARFAAFGLAAALVLGVGGTAAAGTYLALSNSSIAPFAASDVTPEQRVAAGSSVVTDLRAADPDGGSPWALRVSRSDTGLQCSAVGQLKDGAFGIVGLDGTFRELPEANADACGEPGTLLGTRIFAAERSRDVRTVVNGIAGPDLERVMVDERVVPHTAEGAFLAVLRRYPEDAQPVVTLRMKDGTTRRHAFAGDGFVVADPYGGRAWKLESFGFGVPPGTKQGPTQTGCVHFVTARSVPAEPNVSSPPVCGLQTVRAGARPRTLWFDTRRLSGSGPARSFMGGNWNDHPPRVAVWGSAWSHKRIVVRAGRFQQAAAPKLNGTFLVLLPLSTDPDDVTVEVDGKRYGSSFGTVRPPKGAR